MRDAGAQADGGDIPPPLRNPVLRWLNRYILLDELLARRQRVIPRMTARQWAWYCVLVVGGLQAATWLYGRAAHWLHPWTEAWPAGFLLRWAVGLGLWAALYAVWARLLPARAQRALVKGEWVVMWLLWAASNAAWFGLTRLFG